MSDHPFAPAPSSTKPYLGISYYSFQEWVPLIDQDKLNRWELLRLKLMHERYAVGRTFIQLPIMALSYWAGHVVMGPPLRRRDAGFRDTFVFATFFYVLFHHWVDQLRAPDRFLDELFTQPDPDGQYLRQMTKEHYPELWKDLREQLIAKGAPFKEPQAHRWDNQPVDFDLLFRRKV